MKLKRLTAERGKAAVSDAAGLTRTAISNYLSKRQRPRIDAALKISKALKVPLEWLADDSADWPPPPRGGAVSPANLSDRELMLEVARRHRLEMLRVLYALDAAEKIDWSTAATTIPMQQLAPIVAPLYFWTHLATLYHPENTARANHASMPGSDRPAADFQPQSLLNRFSALAQIPGFTDAVAKLMAILPAAGIEGALDWPGSRQVIPSPTPPPAVTTDASPDAAPPPATPAPAPPPANPTPGPGAQAIPRPPAAIHAPSPASKTPNPAPAARSPRRRAPGSPRK